MNNILLAYSATSQNPRRQSAVIWQEPAQISQALVASRQTKEKRKPRQVGGPSELGSKPVSRRAKRDHDGPNA